MYPNKQNWKCIGTIESLTDAKKEWLKENVGGFKTDRFDFVYITEELLTLYILKWAK